MFKSYYLGEKTFSQVNIRLIYQFFGSTNITTDLVALNSIRFFLAKSSEIASISFRARGDGARMAKSSAYEKLFRGLSPMWHPIFELESNKLNSTTKMLNR